MKRNVIAAVAVLALGASMAFAAPHGNKLGGKRGRGAEHGSYLVEKLNLTEAQKQQIRDIRQQSRQQNAAFFQTMRQTRQELRAAKQANDTAKAESLKAALENQREQMKQLREAEKARALSVLTAEQRAEYERLEAEKKTRRQERRGKRN